MQQHIQVESKTKLVTQTNNKDKQHASDHSEGLHLPVTEKETKPQK